MAAPGVTVTTATRSGPSSVVLNPSGQYFVVGLTERGPIDAPMKINSLADYKRIYGDRVTYGALYDDLAMFFETGGTQAWVLRVAGPAATVGTITVNDGAGSPVPTLKFDAANPGSWSSRLTVKIENGTAGSSTRKVSVLLDGVAVEVYNNLTSPADIAAKFAKSIYVKVTDLGSATVAPNNLPATNGAGTPLTAGTDDRTSVNAASIAAALPLLKIGLGDGAVAAPGYGAAVHVALMDHAKNYRRVALLTGAKGASSGDLQTLGISLASNPGAEYAGLFGPWVQVGDGSGGVRTISPEGYVAGCRAKAHDQIGPWAAPAGDRAATGYILGLDQDFSRADAENLDAARVSPIRLVQSRIRLYGWRSVSGNEADYAALSVGDLLNRLVTECEARLEPFVFATIDGRGHLFSQMAGTLIGVLEPIRAKGGIFENIDPLSNDVIDRGYTVAVDRNLNTPDTLARNEVRAQIAVRPSPTAALITLTIVKVGLNVAV
jgi:hypothetical protein